MDFITNFFTLNTLAYALIGIPALFGFTVLMRLSKKGRISFEDRHEAMEQRIQQTSSEVDELNKTMHQQEQLHIIASALREALHLHPTSQAHVHESDDHVILYLEKFYFLVLYKEKKQVLQSTKRTVYGQGYFEVVGPLPLDKKESAFAQCMQHMQHTQQKQQPSRTFYSLMELELYLTQKMKHVDILKLPPALRPR